MLLFILQEFLERVAGDPRLLQEAVYIEIGQLIETHCRALGPQALSKDAKREVEALLRIEVASSVSGVGSYDGCAALLERIYERGLFAEGRFENLSLDFLNAAAAQMTEVDAHDLKRSVELAFEEHKGGDLQQELLSLMMRVYFNCTACLSSNARYALCAFVNGAIDCEQDRRIVETYEEVANLTAIVRWSGLSDRDRAKGNCIRLVKLLEGLPDIGNQIDFERHDCLTGRREIFKEEATSLSTHRLGMYLRS